MASKTKTKSKTNVSKLASAQYQSAKDIQRAASGEAGLKFYSVISAKGNGYFTLRNEDGKDVRGTPRGLLSRGTMRISVGQIVVAQGDSRLGLEIVGVIQERSYAEKLAADGALPRKVLADACSAGAMHTIAETEDDLFEGDSGSGDDAVPEARGGVKAQRAQADAMRSVASLVSRLGSKSANGFKAVAVENAAEDVMAAAESDAFSVPKVKRVVSKPVAAAPRSIPRRPAVAAVTGPSVWDMASSADADEHAYSTALIHSQRPDPTSWEEFDIDAI